MLSYNLCHLIIHNSRKPIELWFMMLYLHSPWIGFLTFSDLFVTKFILVFSHATLGLYKKLLRRAPKSLNRYFSD